MDTCNKCEVCKKFCEIVPEMARFFKSLGDLTRLQIINLLATDCSGTLGVGDLAERLGISQPAVSQHLKTLKAEGIVDSRREGFYVYYSFNRERMVRFREYFDLMYRSVMDRCDQELLRKTSPDLLLNLAIICYSYTGVTRDVAEQIRDSCGGEIVSVKTREKYNTFTAYTRGVLRSRQGESDAIDPEVIDVSPYDLLVIATPVWAWKPAPAINAAVKALRGCEGKKAVILVTCNGQFGESIALLKQSLEARGVIVSAEIGLTKRDVGDIDKRNGIIGQIVSAYNS
jgi:DNA-binding transcriptional ArsR family regulator